jgi:oligoendopeptidase F
MNLAETASIFFATAALLLLYCIFTADLPLPLLGRYPMNLAETASIFFETVVGDRLVALASTPQVLRNSAFIEP